MKKIAKYFPILLIVIITSVVVIYIQWNKNNEKERRVNKTKETEIIIIPNNNRIYKNYTIIDSFDLKDAPGKFKILPNNDLVFHYIQTSKEYGGFNIYSTSTNKLNNITNKGFSYDIINNSDSIFALIRYKENNNFFLQKWYNNKLIDSFLLNSKDDDISTIGFLDSTKYYITYKYNDIFFAVFYKTENTKPIDTISFEQIIQNNIMGDELPFLGVIFSGSFTKLNNDSVLYKTHNSSFSYLYSSKSKQITEFQTIDSTPLPTLVTKKYDNGTQITQIDDSKYLSYSIKTYDDNIFILDFIKKENKVVLSCYNSSFQYKYSLDFSDNDIYPSDFDFLLINNEISLIILSRKNNKVYKIKLS